MVRKISTFVINLVRALFGRLDRSPIDSMSSLKVFLQTQSASIAQTTLFGYLRTRMGTRYREMFQDDVFAVSIRRSSAQIFASCLADLTIFSITTISQNSDLRPDEAEKLALDCYQVALRQGLEGVPTSMIPQGVEQDFTKRAQSTDWRNSADATIFTKSATDLVRYAPVAEEFKLSDQEILGNSIRFRWRTVREQFVARVDAKALCRFWRLAELQDNRS